MKTQHNKCPECGKAHRSLKTVGECINSLQFEINWQIIAGNSLSDELLSRKEKLMTYLKKKKFKLNGGFYEF